MSPDVPESEMPPGVESAGVESAGVESAGVESPGVESPGVESPGVELTGVESPGVELTGELRRGQFRSSLDLTVPASGILGVLGPNGSGKSTLLRTLAGLLPLHSGRLSFDGQIVDEPAAGVFVPPERRPVGLVFQDYRLFPHLSVLDNVAFAARSTGTGRIAARAGARNWLERLGVAELAQRRPGQLSGGQAQRVALARALAARPRLLLLDEPLAALDARTRTQVRTELHQHLRNFDGPTLLVTHDPLEAMVLTDRLLVIEDGVIVQQGRPADVARRPATHYVARLVGLNLYRGRRRPDGHVELDDGGVLVAEPDGSISGAGQACLVALRPSAITLYTERPGPGSSRNVWQGRVAGLELLTDRVRVQVTGVPDALVDITAAAAAELALGAGSPVWLSAKATELDCYPAAAAEVSAR